MELVPIGMYQLSTTKGMGIIGVFIFILAIIASIALFRIVHFIFDSIEKENKFNAILYIFILIFLIPLNSVMYTWALYSKPVYTQQYSVQITKDTDIYKLSQEYEITGISDGVITVIAKENIDEIAS